MRKRRNSLVAAAVVAVAISMLAAGCGYHFGASGSNLPSGAKTIYVARFANHTRQTGINHVFMRYLNDEIASHHRLELVDSPADADLQLTGEILTITELPSSFNSVLEPTIYNESMSVSAQLKDLRTNRVIWTGTLGNIQHDPIVAQAVVPTLPTFVQGNLRSSDVSKLTDMQVASTQGALTRQAMMQSVARNLYAEMAEGF